MLHQSEGQPVCNEAGLAAAMSTEADPDRHRPALMAPCDALPVLAVTALAEEEKPDAGNGERAAWAMPLMSRTRSAPSITPSRPNGAQAQLRRTGPTAARHCFSVAPWRCLHFF